MFLFNSLEKGSYASRNAASSSPDNLRNKWLGVFVLAVIFYLSAALLFSGCQIDDDSFIDDHTLNSQLIGTWFSTYDDSYVIEETETGHKLTYYGFTGMISYAGVIRYVSNFSEDAGVIIIEYDIDHKPTYYDSYENYGDPNHIMPLKGNFIGIYYKELKPGFSVKIGGAYANGGAEEETLDAAKKAFTLGNEGDYMSMYGTYLK